MKKAKPLPAKKSKAAAKKATAKKAAPAPAANLHWKDGPEDHDYPAAADFLSLVLAPDTARATVKALRKAHIEHRKAKDILRASRLDLLPDSNPHVRADLAKIASGVKLSPVLLVRGDGRRGAPLLIADGFHRVCASYHLDENIDIPIRLADIARGRD